MPADLFRDAGGLRPAYDAVDWASTPLGPVEGWPPALRDALDVVLNTRFPMTLVWGPELVLLYNDAYEELIGEKHPAALGARTADVFPETWAVNGPRLRRLMSGAGATWVQDAYVPMFRHGYLEDCWFTYSFSPVHDDDGVAGVLAVAAETTSQVVTARRLQVLTHLAQALTSVEDVEELRWEALTALARDLADLPEVDLVLETPSAGRTPTAGAGRRPAAIERDEHGVVRLPLRVDRLDGPGGLLVVRTSPGLPFDDGYREFLFMLASTVSRALDRIDVVSSERQLSTALQRSLLTEPAAMQGVSLAVRYLPASRSAHVGGDWYDAFAAPDGDLTLVVGDVAGHDQTSAAAMGQLRNMLRAIAFTTNASPAQLLTRVDEAVNGLGVEVVATVLVTRCHRRPGGGFDVTWSSAGHPPLVVLRGSGRAELVDDGDGDVLLGLEPSRPRTERSFVLGAGETLLLYTDGLVERRGASLDESLAGLVARLTGRQREAPSTLGDQLLLELGGPVEDDVVLLVLRADA